MQPINMIMFCYWDEKVKIKWSSARAGYDTRSIFKRSLTGFNSKFSFSWTSCLTKAEESSQPYYLPIAGGRIIGFIPFPRVLVLCEMQSFSSRIWTRVVVSISYDDNHYTTGTSNTKKMINKKNKKKNNTKQNKTKTIVCPGNWYDDYKKHWFDVSSSKDLFFTLYVLNDRHWACLSNK